MVVEASIQLNLDIPKEDFDQVVAVLSEIGYYAFEETPSVLKAFIMESDYDSAAFDQAIQDFFPELRFSKTVERIEAKDWNAEWEANFHSVTVGDFCEVHLIPMSNIIYWLRPRWPSGPGTMRPLG